MLVPMFRYGLTLRVDFGNLAGGRDTGIDRCFAFLREFRLLESVTRMQHRDYWTQNDVIQRIGRKS